MTTRGHHGLMLGGGGAFTYATWNPADKDAGLSLSGGDLVILRTGSGWCSARATQPKNSGKWVFEVTQDAFGAGGSLIVGLALASASLSTFIGANVSGWSFQPSATPQPFTYFNSTATAVAGYPNITTTQKVMFAVDITNGRCWCRTTGAGGWARGGDPAAGTTPTFTFTPGATVYPATSGDGSGQQSTLNSGATPFSMAVPAGFNAGWYS